MRAVGSRPYPASACDHCRDRHRPEGFPIVGFCGLDRPGAAAGFNERQEQGLGHISKQGDRYLRRILVVGAHAVLRRARQHPEKYPWLTALLARRPFKVVAVAPR
jgi:transposase